MKRESLKLTEKQWAELKKVTAKTGSKSTTGIKKGQPSWRALIRRIADGELEVKTKGE